MNPSCAAHNRHCEDDLMRDPLQRTRQKRISQRIKTLSDFSFRLELELEANRRQRNERRQRHYSSGNMNGFIPQTTDIAESKIERICSQKHNDPECFSRTTRSKGELVERHTEKKAVTHRQNPHQIILERIHNRGLSSVPVVLQMKQDDGDDFLTVKQQQRQVGTRNGRRRSRKNSIRSIPSTPSERNEQQQQTECQDCAASVVSGDSSSGGKQSVSRSFSSSETTYRGDSSQSGSSFYTETSSQSNGVLSSTSLQSGRNISVQIRRKTSSHNMLHESFKNFDQIQSNPSEVNLFEDSSSNVLPTGGVHGNSLSMLHNSYSSLQVGEDEDDRFSPRAPASLHHSLSNHRVRQRREECLAELRQQQRQIAETLRHIKENPVKMQDISHAQGLSRFHRSWKNRNGAAAEQIS